MILRLILGSLIALGIIKLFHPKPTDAELDARLLTMRDERAKATGETLDPLISIVDLLQLLGLNPTFESRRDLWREFKLAGTFTGTAEQNQQLIQELRKQLAAGDFGF